MVIPSMPGPVAVGGALEEGSVVLMEGMGGPTGVVRRMDDRRYTATG